MSNSKETKQNPALDSNDRVQEDTYDRGIVPAETAARKEREEGTYKQQPSKTGESTAKTNDQTEADSVDTADGYTVDREGLLNNYAVEPEMYIDEPGDLHDDEYNQQRERDQELHEINQDKDGELTMDRDMRGKGPGMI